MNQPIFSIIVVTWNRCNYLKTCLDSIKNQTYPSYEVVVVDNGSSDGTERMVQDEFPDYKFIRLDRNLGCTGARNIGILNSEGEIIFFVDDDGALESNVLEITAKEMVSDTKIGAVVGSIREHDKWLIRPLESERGQKVYLADFFGQCAIKREIFNKLGLYSDYSYSAEELDLSIRMLAAGFQIVFQPLIRTIHYNANIGRPKGQILQKHRNILRVVWKYAPFSIAFAWTLPQLTILFREGIRSRDFFGLLTEIPKLIFYFGKELRNRSVMSWEVFAVRRFLNTNSVITPDYWQLSIQKFPSPWAVILNRLKDLSIEPRQPDPL